jgi:hypothetical protein
MKHRLSGISIQNYRLFGLCPSSGIQEAREHSFPKVDVSVLKVTGETPTLLAPLERANLNYWTTHVSITVAI